jgi:hypothetical protein
MPKPLTHEQYLDKGIRSVAFRALRARANSFLKLNLINCGGSYPARCIGRGLRPFSRNTFHVLEMLPDGNYRDASTWAYPLDGLPSLKAGLPRRLALGVTGANSHSFALMAENRGVDLWDAFRI